jgi:hypothetical protein
MSELRERVRDRSAAAANAVEDGVRTGFLKAAFHTVTDSQFNIVKDVGRDWLLTAKHPISIEPVCE